MGESIIDKICKYGLDDKFNSDSINEFYKACFLYGGGAIDNICDDVSGVEIYSGIYSVFRLVNIDPEYFVEYYGHGLSDKIKDILMKMHRKLAMYETVYKDRLGYYGAFIHDDRYHKLFDDDLEIDGYVIIHELLDYMNELNS